MTSKSIFAKLCVPDDYTPVPRLTKNPQKADNKLVRLTAEQYKDEVAYCEAKMDEMMMKGWDWRGDANKKLLAINKKRKATGYQPLRAFIFPSDMTGAHYVRYLLPDGTRLMIPHENDFIDMFIFEHLLQFKLLFPDPWTEAAKTTEFCQIWEYDEDAYIMQYHRWLSDVDLETELVDGDSDREDETNMGGIALKGIENFIDSLPSDDDVDVSSVSKLDLFDDSVASKETSVLTVATTGSPASGSGTSDCEIDSIHKRPFKWGIMTQVDSHPNKTAEEEDTKPPASAEKVNSKHEDEESNKKTEATDESTEEDSKSNPESTNEDSSNSGDTNEDDSLESPAKKQKTNKSDDEDSTVKGEDNSDDDSSKKDNDDSSSSEQDDIPSGIEILSTGSFSY
ncbi:unknown protein [Seminavis robusta]|uniref:Uncharacterized protein n=1 Tax=Seminavis robusta TaxID=568900 RepID=A0A9N8F103_9STRA|nr:unknown protein [Seminavis robusta]|eukprot:Sro2700_g335040.1 n/a (396) ;mRNA; r:5088-6275